MNPPPRIVIQHLSQIVRRAIFPQRPFAVPVVVGGDECVVVGPGIEGVVAEGAAADLVLFGANPLEDIEAVLEPALVLKGGQIVAGSAQAP